MQLCHRSIKNKISFHSFIQIRAIILLFLTFFCHFFSSFLILELISEVAYLLLLALPRLTLEQLPCFFEEGMSPLSTAYTDVSSYWFIIECIVCIYCGFHIPGLLTKSWDLRWFQSNVQNMHYYWNSWTWLRVV